MKFTLAQEKAYKALNDNYLISAGAGSGKTQVLSERVRYLVQEYDYHIDEFLILTFTNLAAGEMKNRIRKKLIEINSPEADKVDNAFICTFDSFALSIVKKYHYLLNLTKNIKPIDDNLIKIYIKNKINEELMKHYQIKDPVLINFINRFCYKSDKVLKDLIFDVYQASQNSLSSEDYLTSLREKGSLENAQKLLIAYSNKLDTLLDYLMIASGKCESENFQKKFFSLVNEYNSSDSLDKKVQVFLKNSFPQARGMEEEDKKNYDKAKSEFIDNLKVFTSTKNYLFEVKENINYTEWIITFVKKLLIFDQEYKQKQQAFTFTDIAKFAIKILKDNPSIAEEIKNHLKTIMIDEYQDTAQIQEELISLISNNNVYMVGDVKQSIYRFRNATPELFKEKFASYQQAINGKLISLHDNFRSRKEVLRDINTIFSLIMSNELGGANYKREHIIRNGNKTYDLLNSKESYHLDYLRYDNTCIEDKSEEEAKIIATDILQKIDNNFMVFDGNLANPQLRKVKLSDFCILLDRGSAFFKYQKVFKKYQIPLFIENNVDISSHQIVMSITSLLRLINYIKLNQISTTEFKHAFVSFCRSFICSYTDEEIYSFLQEDLKSNELVKEMISFIESTKHLTPYQLIVETIMHYKVYQKLMRIGDIQVNEKYLDNFLNNLRGLENTFTDFSEYLKYFEDLQDLKLKLDVPSSSTEFDAVRLMNIFKSKGLEFPIIYCAGLTTEFNREEYKKEIYLSKKYGIIYPHYSLEKSFVFYQNKDEEIQEDLSEKIRLLYVALTRAKEKIICLLPNEVKEKNISESRCLGDLLIGSLQCFNQINANSSLNYYYFEAEESMMQKLKYQERCFTPILKEKIKHASKDLSLDISYDYILLGEHLHLLMECTNFLYPNFDNLSNFEKNIITRFLNTNLMKSLVHPSFYKEYEFMLDNQTGIIDLLIIDENKAHIVDYKLKNIVDTKYLDQIKVYYSYVKAKFNLETDCYLYSLLTGTMEKLNI